MSMTIACSGKEGPEPGWVVGTGWGSWGIVSHPRPNLRLPGKGFVRSHPVSDRPAEIALLDARQRQDGAQGG